MGCSRANIPLTACEGATFEKRFTWKTGTPPVAVDLTGYSGVCHIRDKITSEDIILDLVDGTGVIIDDQQVNPGGYRMFISSTDLEGICPTHKVRNMVYDLLLISPAPDETVRIQQYGTFTINPAVTRTWTP